MTLMLLILIFAQMSCLAGDLEGCFTEYYPHISELRKSKHLDPKLYRTKMEDIRKTTEKADCHSAMVYVEVLILIDELKYGDIGVTQIDSTLEYLHREVDQKNSKHYNPTKAALLSIEASFQVNGFSDYDENKAEKLMTFVKSNSLPPGEIATSYLRLFLIYSKSTFDHEVIESLFEEGIQQIKTIDQDQLADAYRRMSSYYLHKKKDYKLAAEYLMRSKALMPETGENYGKLVLEVSKLFLDLGMYENVLELHKDVNLESIGLKERCLLHATIAYAAFKLDQSELGVEQLKLSKELTHRQTIYNHLLTTAYLLSEQIRLDGLQDYVQAYEILEEEYYGTCIEDGSSQSGMRSILMHHLMRLEDSLKLEPNYNTLQNHITVIDELSSQSTYPFDRNEVILKELKWLKDNADPEKSNYEEYRDRTLETLSGMKKNEAVAYILNQKIKASENANQQITHSENRTRQISKLLACLLLCVITSVIFLKRRNTIIRKEKSELILLNEMIKNRARYFKIEQEKQKQNFQYVAHDIRGPLQRLNRLQNRILSSASHREISSIRAESETISASIESMLEELNITLAEESQRTTEKKTEIRVCELIKESEMLIDDEYVRPFVINIIGPEMIHSYKNSLLILFKNFLENALKYNASEPLKIDITTDSKQESINIRFIDYKSEDADEKTVDNQGYGLGLKICEKIVSRYNGRLKQIDKTDRHIIEFSLE